MSQLRKVNVMEENVIGGGTQLEDKREKRIDKI